MMVVYLLITMVVIFIVLAIFAISGSVLAQILLVLWIALFVIFMYYLMRQ